MNQESIRGHERSNNEIDHDQANQHKERLQHHHEKLAEEARSNTRNELEARHEVHEHAISSTEHNRPQAEQRQSAAPTTKADKEHSFNTTMAHVRHNLSRPEKNFSKFIHKPAVEKTSEVLGKTIARPSGIVGATVAAFIGLFSVYGIAKFSGFPLSGSEMPLLLLSGFVVGLFIEWAYKAIRAILTPTSDKNSTL